MPDAPGLEDRATAAALRPYDADAQAFYGNALVEAGDPGAAVACYRAALDLRPDHAPTHYNLGNAHLLLGDFPPAEAAYRQALRGDARHAGTHNNLGNALRAQGRLGEAADAYAAALALRPDLAGTHNNFGSALIALRRPADALPPLSRALALQPAYAEAANNLAGALLALDRPEEALVQFRAAQSLDPDLAQAEFGAAMALLSLGRLLEGFRAYEARWRDPGFVADEPERPAPLWDGSDPGGRTILLHAEQGFGDTIQFARYAPLLRARGATVNLEVQAPLVPLLAGLADRVIAAGTPPPPHDMRAPLLSLPRLFGTELVTIPPPAPLAVAPADLGPGRHVGIVMAGSPDHPEDDLRSIPPPLWAPVLARDAVFHALWPGPALPGLRSHGLADFEATASVVAACDLVITVDTAVAHLAGTLGRPVWVLLQRSPDWRWLRGRDDSPWYPSARLFRQISDWSEVLRRVASAL